MSRSCLALVLLLGGGVPRLAMAQGIPLDLTIPPGLNFDKAQFRLWLPPGASGIRATVVLVPGSNGDWRAMVSDTAWQAFAVRNHVALVGCQLTDMPHEQSFIEDYVNVSRGSGQALLDALTQFAEKAKEPGLATAPLLLWGMSAGGQFNYEFVNWQPGRVAGFVVNKGGIYYTALTSLAARNVPGMLFTGGKDLESRVSTITGLFALNRRGAALWAIAEEPAVGHVVGRSRDVTMAFFEDLLTLRVPEGVAGKDPVTLRTLTEKSGFIGDPRLKTFLPAVGATMPNYSTAWLPTERVAKMWQAMVSEKPFN